MEKMKFGLIFLTILLGIFIFNGILFAIYLFGVMFKYFVIAGLIAIIVMYFLNKQK